MKKLNLFLFIVALFGVINSGLAQNGNTPINLKEPAFNSVHYKTAFGLRAGGTSGLTIKHFVASDHAIEAILGTLGKRLNLTVLYERQIRAFNVPGLNWYYGIGGHFGAGELQKPVYIAAPIGTYSDGTFGFGVDGIVGIEYKIQQIPFAFSLDFKPFMDFNNEGAAWIAIDPGMGIKFTF